MKIGVVGAGVVGRATARAWLEHAEEVRVFDVVRERRTHPRDEVYECDLVFICVPESEVEAVLEGVLPSERGTNLVIVSTTPIGTTKRLAETYELPNLIHSPCFVTARCAVSDAQMPARNIIGVPTVVRYGSCAALLLEAYRKRFPGVPIHLMSSDESECVKLITNAFFAAKIAFFNEARTLTQALGLDWDVVLGAVLADGRISHAHARVPGPSGEAGFGGKCLIKDAQAFVLALQALDLRADVTAGALARNETDRGRTHEDRR